MNRHRYIKGGGRKRIAKEKGKGGDRERQRELQRIDEKKKTAKEKVKERRKCTRIRESRKGI